MPGDPTVSFIVRRNVRVEQVERHAANVGPPNLRANRALADHNLNQQRRTVFGVTLMQRQLRRISFTVQLLLPTDPAESLAKVAIVIEQANRDERQPQVTGGLQMIAGQHTQTAGVKRQRVVHSKLRAKISDWILRRDGRRDG